MLYSEIFLDHNDLNEQMLEVYQTKTYILKVKFKNYEIAELFFYKIFNLKFKIDLYNSKPTKGYSKYFGKIIKIFSKRKTLIQVSKSKIYYKSTWKQNIYGQENDRFLYDLYRTKGEEKP